MRKVRSSGVACAAVLAGVGFGPHPGRHAHRAIHLGIPRRHQQQQGDRDLQRDWRAREPRGGGYNVQMFFNGSTTPGLTLNLTGTVADGDVYVHRSLWRRSRHRRARRSDQQLRMVQRRRCGGAPPGHRDDRRDRPGRVRPRHRMGVGSNQHRRQHADRRLPAVCAGDIDGSDAFDPLVQWEGFVANTLREPRFPHRHLRRDDDRRGAGRDRHDTGDRIGLAVPLNADLTMTFSEPVNVGALVLHPCVHAER